MEKTVTYVEFVYALVHPDMPDVPRYIGSTRDLEQRLRGHINSKHESNPRIKKWIQDLKDQGLTPKIISLEEVMFGEVTSKTTEPQTREREKDWINQYAGTGLLFNIKNNPYHRQRVDALLMPPIEPIQTEEVKASLLGRMMSKMRTFFWS